MPTWLRRLILGFLLLAGGTPTHVAFVMDGNRRFAEQGHMDKLVGHEHGYSKMVEVIRWCLELGVQYISVYAFSIDNFQRSPEEVGSLMHLAERKYAELAADGGLAEREGVEIRILGDLDAPPPAVRGASARLMHATAHLPRKRAVLNICFAYTSCDELACAVDEVQRAVRSGALLPGDVTPALLTRSLRTAECPPVDLLVRTSGETRLSDFLTWQVGRAQLAFVPRLWPDFAYLDFARCIADYQRKRGARARIDELLLPRGASRGCTASHAASGEASCPQASCCAADSAGPCAIDSHSSRSSSCSSSVAAASPAGLSPVKLPPAAAAATAAAQARSSSPAAAAAAPSWVSDGLGIGLPAATAAGWPLLYRCPAWLSAAAVALSHLLLSLLARLCGADLLVGRAATPATSPTAAAACQPPSRTRAAQLLPVWPVAAKQTTVASSARHQHVPTLQPQQLSVADMAAAVELAPAAAVPRAPPPLAATCEFSGGGGSGGNGGATHAGAVADAASPASEQTASGHDRWCAHGSAGGMLGGCGHDAVSQASCADAQLADYGGQPGPSCACVLACACQSSCQGAASSAAACEGSGEGGVGRGSFAQPCCSTGAGGFVTPQVAGAGAEVCEEGGTGRGAVGSYLGLAGASQDVVEAEHGAGRGPRLDGSWQDSAEGGEGGADDRIFTFLRRRHGEQRQWITDHLTQ